MISHGPIRLTGLCYGKYAGYKFGTNVSELRKQSGGGMAGETWDYRLKKVGKETPMSPK